MILIWQFGECVKITKLTYAIIDPFILQAWVMGFSPHRTEIHQFKIPPTAFSEQTVKYFCLYGIHPYTLIKQPLKLSGLYGCA